MVVLIRMCVSMTSLFCCHQADFALARFLFQKSFNLYPYEAFCSLMSSACFLLELLIFRLPIIWNSLNGIHFLYITWTKRSPSNLDDLSIAKT